MNQAEKNTLESGAQNLGLTLNSRCEQNLIDFLYFLQKWNKAYNLTAITSIEKMLTHHVLDSLAIAPYLNGSRILDVGSGAGFPGIPLAFYYPDKEFVLLDSVGKKVRFMLQAKIEFQIQNIEPIQCRMEKFNAKHCFDVIICRAVGSMNEIIQASKHLLSQNGQWFFMKGIYPQQELDQLQSKGGEYKTDVQEINVPGVDALRHLVIVADKEG